MSKNKETEKIEYSATDSIVYDLDNQKVFLYKNAKVNYQNSEVTAGFISIHFNTNIIIAKGVYDSLETYVQKPILRIGLPERYIFENGSRDYHLDNNGLSVDDIHSKIKDFIS